jgi:hypothetical protein
LARVPLLRRSFPAGAKAKGYDLWQLTQRESGLDKAAGAAWSRLLL